MALLKNPNGGYSPVDPNYGNPNWTGPVSMFASGGGGATSPTSPYPGMLSPTAPGPGWTQQGTGSFGPGGTGQGWYPPGYTGAVPQVFMGGPAPMSGSPTGGAPTLAAGPTPMSPLGATSTGASVGTYPSSSGGWYGGAPWDPYHGASQNPNAPSPASSPTLTGGPVSNYSAAYGGIPSVPNPTTTQGTNLTGNIGNLGSLYNLSQGTGAASGAGAGANLSQNFPAALGLISQGGQNAQSLLSGQIPQDVLNQMYQSSAEGAAASGLAPGSPATNATLTRQLGLTSLGLQQQGLQNLGSLIGMTPQGPNFNPSSQLTTPQDAQAWQYLANQLAAAPIPAAAAAANINALRAGANQGRGQTNTGQPYTDPTAGMGGAGALGFGGVSGQGNAQGLGLGAAPSRNAGTLTGPLGSAYAGSSDPSQDPTAWMNPNEAQIWGQMSPDQQYEEALMGYPSFTGDTGQTTAGSQFTDPSNPNYWDFTQEPSPTDMTDMSNVDMSQYYGDGG